MIDEEILAIIQRRMNVVKEIGKNKKENNIRILQTDRWMQIIEKAKQKGNSKGLSDEFIEKLFKAIHQESINIQTEILNS